MTTTATARPRKWPKAKKRQGPIAMPPYLPCLVSRDQEPQRYEEQFSPIKLGLNVYYVHRSAEGVKKLIELRLGSVSGHLETNTDEGTGKLYVPDSEVSMWIGSHGVVAGFISGMLGVSVEVVGKPEKHK
jgi:hypothetical protein